MDVDNPYTTNGVGEFIASLIAGEGMGEPLRQALITAVGSEVASGAEQVIGCAKAYVTNKLSDVKVTILDGLMAAKETIITKVQGLLVDLSGVGSLILGKIRAAKDTLVTKAS